MPRIGIIPPELQSAIQSASAACMVAARQGLDAAIEAVGTELQNAGSKVLDLMDASSFMPLAQNAFDAGMGEAEARVRLAPVRSLAALRVVQLTNAVTKAAESAPAESAPAESAPASSGLASTPSMSSGDVVAEPEISSIGFVELVFAFSLNSVAALGPHWKT